MTWPMFWLAQACLITTAAVAGTAAVNFLSAIRR
jgi:hypothetical protein